MTKRRRRKPAQRQAASVSTVTRLGTLTATAVPIPEYPGLDILWNGRLIAVVEVRSPITDPANANAMVIHVYPTDEPEPESVLVLPGYGEETPPTPERRY